jgi:hypothetical protein
MGRARRKLIERAVAVAVGAAFVSALLVTLVSGVPHPLPAVALGSEALLYIERGVAVFGALVIAIGLLGRGLRGELPSQYSTTGLGYSEKLERAVSGSDSAIAALTARVDRLDEDLAKRDEVMALMASQMLELSDAVREEKDASEQGEAE